jgi:hypothetical protein
MIERSLAFYNGYFESRGVGLEGVRDLLTPYMAAAQAGLPRVMATVEAMAQGAYVPWRSCSPPTRLRNLRRSCAGRKGPSCSTR